MSPSPHPANTPEITALKSLAAPFHWLDQVPFSLIAGAFFVAVLGVYIRTAAPSVLSGDSAEFQFAAPLLGVPHPTTYPLYILLGKLTTLLVPVGEIAWRVTILSSLCGALTALGCLVLVYRIGQSKPAALLATLALSVAPGLWNAATIAEVYALLMLLLATLILILTLMGPPTTVSLTNQGTHPWRLYLSGFIAGLGCTHHGLFVLTALPLFATYILLLLIPRRLTLTAFALLALCFVLGLTPLSYPLIQFARYGPFDGVDVGLPTYYFWGAPTSWRAVFDLMTGGDVRRGIFQLPSIPEVVRVLHMVGNRLIFEFGPLGVLLGLVGAISMFRYRRDVGIGLVWICLATSGYLLLLGPAVQDAPVFTLPIVLPWAVWIGMGGLTIASTCSDWLSASKGAPSVPLLSSILPIRVGQTILIVLIGVTLVWGYSRVSVSSKRHLWLFRDFGQATLVALPSNAAVITHWEQGTILHYLMAIEGQRPDIEVVTVEPQDVNWGLVAEHYNADRPIFFIGSDESVAGLSVELVRADDYAQLFRFTASTDE
ncbi:MAG: DUF2723 domain-containing protein [Chloroflexi bacterium AL-W]|nr:DUF2723 domain-containing protein [Chloroflexi bacterium AL-N1]NOK68164.1 DUF2723 domain-containing protein [Chloroflexi bacterium AL-N10]NOK73504.1 DUF2723 domain-containing protein [Chloroflexi bacterium AL-N5]NOK83418.1 DUF2723 domain-containing protein [Chloroflexi bacterium AL-W]NOK87835.1 DUF2723 domain-containing protein [Chloroflexi bacterium AL-N15]